MPSSFSFQKISRDMSLLPISCPCRRTWPSCRLRLIVRVHGGSRPPEHPYVVAVDKFRLSGDSRTAIFPACHHYLVPEDACGNPPAWSPWGSLRDPLHSIRRCKDFAPEDPIPIASDQPDPAIEHLNRIAEDVTLCNLRRKQLPM